MIRSHLSPVAPPRKGDIHRGNGSRLHRRKGQSTPLTGLRTDRGERVAAAGAVGRQPGAAVGTDLPVRGELVLALLALVEELMPRLLELPDGGL